MARVSDLLAAGRTFSFEFFPPKTDSAQLSLGRTIAELEPLAPSFVSVTYGAGGSSRQRTREVVTWVRRETTITPMAHLTCQGHTRDEIAKILEDYRAAGIENILALGGDPPTDPADASAQRLRVRLRAGRRHRPRRLLDRRRRAPRAPPTLARPRVGPPAPGHQAGDAPTSRSRSSSSRSSPTCASSTSSPRSACDKPVLPGIMPVTNAGQVARMAAMSGAEVPAWLRGAARAASTIRRRCARIGVDVASSLCASCSMPARPGCTSTRSIAARRPGRSTPTSGSKRRRARMTTHPITRPLEWHPPRAAISAVPYLPGLDGMRAIAVAVVMVYHANSAWLPGGFLGVEVFFVISGYLITLLLIGEHERTGSVSLRQLLTAASTTAAAGAVHAADRRHAVHDAVPPRCARPAARRRDRRAHVRRRTGTRSGSARATPRRATSPRCGTSGASPWRSSSTCCGRWSWSA